jgi:NADPH:quinone reductase-like Zn-dependent oxidoreductase
MQKTMRAVVMSETGAPDVLALDELDVPCPLGSEVLVRVRAAGLNPVDAATRAGGGVAAAIGRYPVVLGQDFSGVVVRSPYEAHPLQPGDEVFGMVAVPRYQGSYAELLAVPSLSVARKPATLSHVEAAAVPSAALTAWGLVVDLAKAHEGQRVLVHSAASGVGHLVVQFAAYFGASVTATASGHDRSWLRQLGADTVIDQDAERFDEALDTVDVVIDLAGAEDVGRRSLGIVRSGGLIVNASGERRPGFAEMARSLGVRATDYAATPDAQALTVISRLFDSGAVRVHVEDVFALADAPDAHRALEGATTRGKLVLTVP